MTTQTTPGEIPQAVADAPRILVPDTRTVFARRAERFEQLAEGHSLGDYLRFMGHLSRAQQQALDSLEAVPLPEPQDIRRAHQHGMPLIPAQSWERDPLWQEILMEILDTVAGDASPQAQATIQTLRDLDEEAIEAIADRVLRTELFGARVDTMPFIAAALQVYWTRMAAALGEQIRPLDTTGVCPCCGSLPSVSVIGASSEISSLRYLHCSLCNVEWHLTRAQCSACNAGEKEITYHFIEGGDGVVQAEACNVCLSYLKVVRRDKDGAADPTADDLASLAVDILVDDLDYTRSGPNLLLVPGVGR